MTPVFDFSPQAVADLARADAARALAEDVGQGDLTAALVDPHRRAQARVLARESAVICGAPWAEAALRQVEPGVRIQWLVGEGERCAADQVVLQVEGSARGLLTAERTALNFLQLLSAVATKTATYVEAVRGTRAQIVDTRKTLPGLRLAQKYAVRTGGGTNHRIGLYDAVLIKENHIAAAGGVTPVLREAQRVAGHASFIEIEVETLAQLKRRWPPAPGWSCWTTWTCPRCAKRCGSTAGVPSWRSPAASPWSGCAPLRKPAWTASRSEP
jgi:nicotinate-nucleotide pyrophosphorylase (carboxylating)